jgi:hypothetical protein
MKARISFGFLIVVFIAGTVLAAAPDSKAAFATVKRDVLRFHASLISHASPQVRAGIAASAVASRKYLAGCGSNCDLYRFLSGDLKKRFKALTEQDLHVLMALTVAELIGGKLAAVGDDSQLANVDLQNALQKQQQTLQMLSNITKMTNDTAMAVIRKIGG